MRSIGILPTVDCRPSTHFGIGTGKGGNLYTSHVKAIVLDRIALILSFVGIYIAGMLSFAAAFGSSIPCMENSGCDIVANHPTSRLIGGIPNAYFGFAVYILLSLLVMGRMFGWMKAQQSAMFGFVITGLGTLASIALVFVSLSIIKAECLWCMASAATMIFLFILHAVRLQSSANEEFKSSNLNVPLAGAAGAICLINLCIGFATIKQAPLNTVRSVDFASKAPDTFLPEDTHFFGEKTAPITILEFGDLLCPTCKREYPKIRGLVTSSNGKIRYAFRHFPMYTLQGHVNALPAAIISEVADEKGKFWDFVSGMYGVEFDQLQDIQMVYKIANALGLDQETYLKRIQDPNDPAFKRVQRDKKDGASLGVEGTPAMFILAPGVNTKLTTPDMLEKDLQAPEYTKFFNTNG